MAYKSYAEVLRGNTLSNNKLLRRETNFKNECLKKKKIEKSVKGKQNTATNGNNFNKKYEVTTKNRFDILSSSNRNIKLVRNNLNNKSNPQKNFPAKQENVGEKPCQPVTKAKMHTIAKNNKHNFDSPKNSFPKMNKFQKHDQKNNYNTIKYKYSSKARLIEKTPKIIYSPSLQFQKWREREQKLQTGVQNNSLTKNKLISRNNSTHDKSTNLNSAKMYH